MTRTLSGIFVVLFGGLAAAETMDGKLAASDEKFVQKAACGGMAEVKLGQLALERGQSQAVKDFGQKMIDDHSKANDELKKLADQHGVAWPTDLRGPEKATYDRLAKLTGDAFDHAYIKAMVKDHDTDVAEFRKESSSGKNTQLKDWATATLPTLKSHDHMAHDDQKKM